MPTFTLEQLYKAKAETLEKVLQINSQLSAINHEIDKLLAQQPLPVEEKKDDVDTSN